MPMKPKPARHDRRSYRASQDGGSWRELDRAQKQAKTPEKPQYPSYNEKAQGLNSGPRKTAKPKVFTPGNIECSVIKALKPVLQARDGTIYSFSDWTLSGDGVVIVLPNGQEFWLTITEAK